ncbi:MAG: Na/Pi cotransporter family protein [Lachnospiraceae bacterium]|nr:Na/Pi cotransporter family protein [Lachnospiraceae bacterium]
MDFFDVLAMLGGLALFLYGMSAMESGLTKLSGGKLEGLLEKMTSNKLKAVGLGAVVTALVQSSSATTVMVVGLVNSGIMKLSQAIGVIMGANIGTTITSWILSLAGIESNVFWIKLLKPTSFSPILAVIGIVFLMFSKKEKKRDLGTIFVGFAVLMFGMDAMSDAVSGLKNVPEFTEILTMFSNPILGMIAGAVLTAIIQSSSASVGILQTLCLTGSVKVGTALPIIMGQNIGTCVTALISGIGASKNAKRAACVHLYFNLVGTTVFMVLFYTANAFLDFTFLNNVADPSMVAVVHSAFNIVATAVLLPFSGVLEKLATLTVRDKKEEKTEQASDKEKFQILDERFLDMPAFAIEQCREAANRMADLSAKGVYHALHLLEDYTEEEAARVAEIEGLVDHYEDELGTYLVRLSSRQLSKKDNNELNMLLHSIGDFERISDHALNIQEAAKEMHEKALSFSKEAGAELAVFETALRDILGMSVDVFCKEDPVAAKKVEPLEETIDGLSVEMKGRHIKRLRAGACTIELGFILSDLTTNFERIADHCSNIAVCLIQIAENGMEVHEYLDTMKLEMPKDFAAMVEENKKKYALPVA